MEKYFVGSEGDAPEIIYFELELAITNEHLYIDIFDEGGIKVRALKRVEGLYAAEF